MEAYDHGARQERLALALVGPHTDAYLREPSFRHAIDQLAAAIPAMVDGLATAAAEERDRRDARMRAVEDATAALRLRVGRCRTPRCPYDDATADCLLDQHDVELERTDA